MTVSTSILSTNQASTMTVDLDTCTPKYPWLFQEPGLGVGTLEPVAGYDEDDDDEDDDYYSGYDDYDDDDEDFDDDFDDEEEELDFDDDEDDEDL
ncbi:MAG: hypothetical protein H6815_06305 [Phycisphaeraceae bacterium]|nr:hypothetical protein [Phycisphaerales bacterium]MCB9860051.1 hypothetical protein [Phycisphaeraceae bacterium]